VIYGLLGSLWSPTLEGITFADRPGQVYVSARSVANATGRRFEYDSVTDLAKLGGQDLSVDYPRLFSGAILMPVEKTNAYGVEVGKKRVFVDLNKQEIWAWQGKMVVLHSPISSGRELKDTPPGDYITGKKETMHISSIYGSKMPFSVHLKGNYFIHGSELTLSTPGSHGCIRLPMYDNNAAKWFFSWVDQGVSVKVRGKKGSSKGVE